MALLRRLANLFRQDALRREFDDELRAHVEMRTDANLEAGMRPAEASIDARRHLGSPLHVREGMREARLVAWIDACVRDVRHGARHFRRQPGLVALSVFTLSLGIGANAAIYSLLDAAWFRPLPLPAPDRVVAVEDMFRTTGTAHATPTVPEVLDLQGRARTLEGVSFFDVRNVQINGGSEPVSVSAARVEASFFAVLGVQPARGRLFGANEARPGGDHVVLLSDTLWRRNFSGGGEIVGQQVSVNSTSMTVVGVLGPDFNMDVIAGGGNVELYVPFPMTEGYTSRSGEFANVRRVTAIARLTPDATVAGASREVDAIAQAIARANPDLYRRGSDGRDLGFGMSVQPLRDAVAGPGQSLFLLLFGAVGLVLLIACVNTAQFLLARALDRQGEVAIRAALGATRVRLVTQFLTEACLLAAAGGLVGLVEAYWFVDVLRAVIPAHTPGFFDVEVNGAVIAFAAAAAATCAIASGIVPALTFSKRQLVAAMGSRRGAPARARSQQVMIAAEVAVSILLLVVAGLLLRSLHQAGNVVPGYVADDVTVLRMRMNSGAIVTGPRLLPLVTALPGVGAAAMADGPIAGAADTEFSIAGGSEDAATLSRQTAGYRIVSPDYFSTLGIPLRQGRTFTSDDGAGRPAVAIVNEELARRMWPAGTAVGQQLRAGTGPRRADMTVVGVVGNVRASRRPGESPQIYVSYLQQNEPNLTLLVRASPRAALPVEAVKAAMRSIVPDQAFVAIQPLPEIVADGSRGVRVVSVLLGSFAALALFMSIAGIYTVVNYLFTRRTKEIAVCLAIGASERHILRLVAGSAVRSILIGLVMGLGATYAARGVLRAALPDITTVEPLTVVFVCLLYIAVVAAAVAVPVSRALRVDPARVLRLD